MKNYRKKNLKLIITNSELLQNEAEDQIVELSEFNLLSPYTTQTERQCCDVFRLV